MYNLEYKLKKNEEVRKRERKDLSVATSSGKFAFKRVQLFLFLRLGSNLKPFWKLIKSLKSYWMVQYAKLIRKLFSFWIFSHFFHLDEHMGRLKNVQPNANLLNQLLCMVFIFSSENYCEKSRLNWITYLRFASLCVTNTAINITAKQ